MVSANKLGPRVTLKSAFQNTDAATRRPPPRTAGSSYEDVRAVDEVLQPLLGDEQHLVKQEEGSLLLHALHLEGTFQNQLPEAAEVRPTPVHQQGLDFLVGGGRRKNSHWEVRIHDGEWEGLPT